MIERSAASRWTEGVPEVKGGSEETERSRLLTGTCVLEVLAMVLACLAHEGADW